MANKKNLANGIVASNVGTSSGTIPLVAGYGAAMPAVPFYATTGPPGELSTLGNSEIVLVTALATDTATATRGQLGTTAKNIQAGWVFGNGVYVEDINPFNSVVVDETPVGTINGTNKVFVTAQPYIGATLEAFVNGLRQKSGVHFVETTPTTGTFTFDDAPLTGDIVTVGYYFAVGSVSTNSDTVDGYHANVTPTANAIPVLNASGKLPATVSENPWLRVTHAGRPTQNEPTAYAFIKFDLNSAASGGTSGFLSFDAATDRVTIGSGVSKIRISAQFQGFTGPASSDCSANIRLNGVDVAVCINARGTNQLLSYLFAPKVISVTSGDYLEVGFASAVTGDYTWIFDNGLIGWFNVEVVA